MTPFRFEYRFRGTVENYWRAFFDEQCTREQYQLIGVQRFEILDYQDDGDTLSRSIHVMPGRDLPGFIRRVFNTSLGFTETTVWHRSQGHAETEVVPDMFASRVEIVGQHRVTRITDGQFERVFAGSVSARIPVVGGRVAQSIVKEMEHSYELTGQVTQAWLER